MSRPFFLSDRDATCQKCTAPCWHFQDNVPLSPFLQVPFCSLAQHLEWCNGVSLTHPHTHKKFLLKVARAFRTKTLYSSTCPQCILSSSMAITDLQGWSVAATTADLHCGHLVLSVLCWLRHCGLLLLQLGQNGGLALWERWHFLQHRCLKHGFTKTSCTAVDSGHAAACETKFGLCDFQDLPLEWSPT